MIYVLLALLLFGASVMAHMLFCRSCRAKNRKGLQARAFVLIALLFLGIYAWGVSIIQQIGLLSSSPWWGTPFEFSAGAIFVLLIPIYLCFYVLTQLTSPSKKILWSISNRGSLSYKDIVLCVGEEDFINTRLSDLEASGCIKQVRGRYLLSLSGRKINSILDRMQRILGRGIGG